MDKSPVVITGVGKRIGLALARDFVARGEFVIGTYRSEYPALEELRQAGVELHQCDFQEDEQVDQFVANVVSKYRSLRALIHNASDWLPDSMDSQDVSGSLSLVRKMMNVHVNVPYVMNQAFAPLLRAHQDPGKTSDIILITDYVAGVGSKKHIAYAASKAAAENLVQSYAAKLAPDVKVNGIAPALILFNEGDSESYKEKALTKALMPREGGMQEMLETVNYLLNSSYVTGRILHLDGGRHLK